MAAREEGTRVAGRRVGIASRALLAGAVLMTAGAAVGARAWLAPRAGAAKVGVVTNGVDRDDPPPQLPVDVAFTTLDPQGFSPAEIAHEAGRFRIVVQNKSGEASLDLRIEGEGSSRFTERHALGDVHGWTAEVELASGTYTITEASHSQWVCRLSVP